MLNLTIRDGGWIDLFDDHTKEYLGQIKVHHKQGTTTRLSINMPDRIKVIRDTAEHPVRKESR